MITWLDVDIREKDQVKALGAKWDPKQKRWFVPDGMPTTAFRQWLPKPVTRKDKAERFREQNWDDMRQVEWQQRQDQIRSRDRYTCRHCKRTTGIRLEVHHRYYNETGRHWEYPDKDLISLCAECHEREEDALFDAQRVLRRAIGRRDGEAKQMLMLAQALDKAPARHSISDIIGAVAHLIRRDDILDQIVEVNRKPTSSPPASATQKKR